MWICTDQQRQDTLGCYGNSFVKTPNLDNLASQAALFENAFSQSPVCTPSRGAFLSGRYPITCRARQNGADIPSSEVLVTKLFHDAGYYCGLSGKLHLSACNPQSGCIEMEPRIDDGYDEFHWSHDTAPVWGLHNEYYKWLEETFGCTYSVTQRVDSPYVQDGMPEEKHQTTWCAQKAINFIEEQKNSEKPWLFSVNVYDPHHPFDPPKELLDRYLDRLDEIPLPSYWKGEEDSKTLWQKQDHGGAYNHHAGYPYSEMSDYDHRLVRAAYWAMCDLVDRQVGRILDSLVKTGQWENTIVIFQSDHGEMLGDHGIYLKGPFFYDCAVKVPLIVSWPNHIASKKYDALVELMDLPQTLLELCDLPSYNGMQGLSFAHLFAQDALDEHKNDVFCEYLNAMPWHQDPKAFASMLRTRAYKLIIDHNSQKGELYDLQKDSEETKNLFDDPQYQEVKITLLQSLVNRFARTADPIPLRKSDW